MAATTAWRSFGKCRILMHFAAAETTAAETTATKKPSFGLTKPLPISPALSEFMGGFPKASRHGALKKVWDYIKLHKLQNPENKREIFCDQKLKALFGGKDKVGFTEVSRFLCQHFIKKKKV